MSRLGQAVDAAAADAADAGECQWRGDRKTEKR